MRKSAFLVSFFVMLALLTAGCGKGQQTQQTVPAKAQTQALTYQNLSPDAVYQMLKNKENVVVIDVRTAPEFTGPLGHIPGAQLHPLQEIQQWAPQLDSLKNSSKKIVLVCRTGHRSRIATEFLAKRGFHNLINMVGGMMAWNKSGLPVEK